MAAVAGDGTAAHFQQEDHQGAYVFSPRGSEAQADRPSKRRRTSKKNAAALDQIDDERGKQSLFVPLLNGTEAPECVQVRERLFERSWARVESRVQGILRDANSATLDDVMSFVHDETITGDKLPSALIITGANIASQGMLFEQLSERLQASSRSRFVGLKSSETTNVKGALKKIIQEATASGSALDDDEDVELSFGQGDRKYLNYDLEGLHVFAKSRSLEHVFVAFQDSEGFDSALISDLIVLFHSWLPRIPFTLLFGVATSVELLQARLLKSTCQLLHGAQFDVVQAEQILEQVFKPAVADTDVVLRIGPSLLQSLIERQQDHVAGIQAFLSSLKYAYMCHFYANPLSAFATEDDSMNSELVQDEHLEAFRQLPSFRRAVEDAVAEGRTDFAKSCIQDDEFLREMIFEIPEQRRQWAVETLRALSLVKATGAMRDTFPQAYRRALHRGIDLCSKDGFDEVLPSVKRMQPDDFTSTLQRVLETLAHGDAELGLAGWQASTAEGRDLGASLVDLVQECGTLLSRAQRKGHELRSSYSGHSRILRTTVVAQKVQLSRDSAALSDEDKAFTAVVDRATELLGTAVRSAPATEVALHEAWLYDSRVPHRDVLVPRPRAVLERGLTRPHDYLACSCCGGGGANGEEQEGGRGPSLSASLPVTSLLYHLYMEAGGVINVADLWAAFYAMVGRAEMEADAEERAGGGREQEEGGGHGHDERTALALFYRGLAELRALGFVKPSRKKADHIAKLKWL